MNRRPTYTSTKSMTNTDGKHFKTKIYNISNIQ